LINASFDVALEGPMLGIWFWCIIGLGIGSSMLYGASREIRRPQPAEVLPGAPLPALRAGE
jgi:hypothetical protein